MRKKLLFLIDFCAIPLTVVSAIWLKLIRKHIVGFWGTRSPFSKYILNKVGVFPIIDHYYEPYYSPEKLKLLKANRLLPGIDFRDKEQLALLQHFNYQSELLEISKLPEHILNYSFNKGPFLSGDAEILFSFVRYYKPKRIIEVGCGHSTLLMQHAIAYNKKEDNSYTCTHICIEPFENDWLTKLDVDVKREKVEDMEIPFFQSLNEGDFLFIDSTHIIRPQGDVLFEYLQVLPSINKGVIVHIHDIFTPRDYLEEWLQDGVNFWNEQYLLEAFLTFNSGFDILCAVNYLKNKHFQEISAHCPFLTKEREPGSFWMQRK
jgi:Methyltransferase domain